MANAINTIAMDRPFFCKDILKGASSKKENFRKTINMHCWNCGVLLDLKGNVSFRASCDSCHAPLHCCRNCVYYKPGMPNDCLVPNTDFVPDRTTNNFCEEFKPLGKVQEKKVDAKDIAKKLFGDENDDLKEEDPKARFNNLFDD